LSDEIHLLRPFLKAPGLKKFAFLFNIKPVIMKKIIAYLLLVALHSATNFSSAQMLINLPQSEILDEPIGIDLTLKTARLTNGVNLQYAEQGSFSGTPVIFLHGLTDSWRSFESVLSFLPYNIHAFVISQRGHGDSDRPLNGYTPKDFAADVVDFMQLQNLKTAYIVGHSMGGVVAQQFALDYPQLTRGVVIVSSAPSFKNNPGIPEFYEQVLKLKEPMDKTFMDEFQKGTLAKPIDPAYYNLLVAEGMKVPLWVFREAFKGIMNTDFTNQLKSIKAPVLVMWGTKDTYCTQDAQEQLVKGIRDVRLLVYERTGHALHWEEPARFVTDLVGFVTKSTRLRM
jgi:non-heme chloroperoxidase